MADAQQVRITELPAATRTNDEDQYEVSQPGAPGQPSTSRRMSHALLKEGVRPDLTPYVTGIVGGAGITTAGRAPVISVSLANLGNGGTWGDGGHIPEVTVDDYGRVIGIVLVPIDPTDLSGYAPLDSPAFSGDPTAPLQPSGSSNATLASTRFVQQELAPYAPLDSPAFIGSPTAPTQIEDTDTDELATCSFVQQAIALGASITVGDTPPLAPRPNQLWWHSAFGQMFIFYTDENSSQWVPASPSTASTTIPPGSGQDYFGGVVPAGWYLCDGSLKDRLIDAPLFAEIGETYGPGDGETTFALPDCRGRVMAMLDYATGRLTTVADTLGAVGGADSVTLSVAEMPNHNHGVYDPTHNHGATGAGLVGNNLVNGQSRAVGTADGTNSGPYQNVDVTVYGNSTGISVQVAGGGGAHLNTQPTMAVNKLIKR
jgi:microcystin-dependent protein